MVDVHLLIETESEQLTAFDLYVGREDLAIRFFLVERGKQSEAEVEE
jgi:hypothetical protein